MISFAGRRATGLAVTVILAAVLVCLDFALRVHLRPAAIVSGIVLLSLVLLLTLFNARKKLPFLPLLRASTWLQIHIYAGLLAGFLFLLHTRFHWPTGMLELTLAVLFIGVMLSGFFGLAITRILPGRMTLHGENIIFERIPAFRAQVMRETDEMVMNSITATKSSTIADFYEEKLRGFFTGARNLGSHLLAQKKPIHRILSQISELDRYLNDDERKILADIREQVLLKDNLDFQYASQGVLKLWLFVHIPLTYAMLLFAFVHAVLAWNFT